MAIPAVPSCQSAQERWVLGSENARLAVAATARELVRRRLIAGTSGNVSARIDSGMVITPTRTSFAQLDPAELVVVSCDGTWAEQQRVPSIEFPLHLAVYAERRDVGAIVHTHSPHATAWSFNSEPLADLEDLDYYGLGEIGTVAHAKAGSELLARRCVAALTLSDGALLERHGVVAVGVEPMGALLLAEAIEHIAHVSWLLRGRERSVSGETRDRHFPPDCRPEADGRSRDPSRSR